jgi:CBS domain-containing protein
LIVTEFGDEDREPIGIVTDRDIVVEAMAKGVDPEEVTVGDVMSEHPLTASEEDDVAATLESMREQGVRRVPVMDAQSKLVGILALDDLLQVIAGCMSDVAAIVGAQRHTESKVRI